MQDVTAKLSFIFCSAPFFPASLTSHTDILSYIHCYASQQASYRRGEQHWLLSGAIKGFDANQSSLSCQFGMMAEIYNKEKAFMVDA